MQEHKPKQSPGKGTEEPSEGHRADRISIRLRKFPVPKIVGCWKGTRGTRCFMLAAIFFSSPGDGGCQEGAGCTQQGLGCSPLLGATHPCTVLLKENTLPVHFFFLQKRKKHRREAKSSKKHGKINLFRKGQEAPQVLAGVLPSLLPSPSCVGGRQPPGCARHQAGCPGSTPCSRPAASWESSNHPSSSASQSDPRGPAGCGRFKPGEFLLRGQHKYLL